MKKILFLGDICTDSYTKEDKKRFQNSELYNFLKNYDGMIVGNLEAPLLPDNILVNNNKFSLLNRSDFYDFYDFCDYFNLANNHIMDQGEGGLYNTASFLDLGEKEYFGAGVDLESARKPLIFKLDGGQVGILSYCCYSTNSEQYANTSKSGPAPLVYDYIVDDIKKLKSHVDKVIVLPHWGIENEFFPTYDQVSLARKMIDAGADGIIGTHTHTIQAFENVNEKFVYYSLGNFLFNNFNISDCEKYFQGKYNKEGMMVELTYENGDLNFNEYFLKFDNKMLPVLSEASQLETPIHDNNKFISDKLINFNHKILQDNLGLELRFNGTSMQILNTSPLIGESYKPRLEAFKSKVKRVIYAKLKSHLRKYP